MNQRVRVVMAVGLALLMLVGQVLADGPTRGDVAVNAWLQRLHGASKHRAYTGTFVVSANGHLVSARIWHVCDGTQQVERIESLTGLPRSIYRRDDQVMTFFPQTKVAVAERRDSLGLFPQLLQSGDADIGASYQLKNMGVGRIAGFDTDVVHLLPKDQWRYGYRIWSEKKTGLLMQLQTVDFHGRVLEQAAFSDLQLDAPVSKDKLSEMMGQTEGFRVDRLDVQKTTAEAQGWAMPKMLAGFKPVGCFNRTLGPASGTLAVEHKPLQWMFSDGVATVSLFIESFENSRHVREGVTDMGGATHVVSRRLQQWWVTAVGEVPPETLNAFVQGLERRK